jgi:hypothetical protein
VDGPVVTIENRDQLVMPATLRVTFDDKTTRDIRVPVETWQQHKSFDVTVPGGRKIVTATIDPDHVIPDRDRSNNSWPVAAASKGG